MTSDEFLAAIYDFVDGEMEFSRFLDWFGAVLPEIEESGDPLVVETAAQLRLSLAEYGRGHRTTAEVREIMLEALPSTRSFWLDWAYEVVPTALYTLRAVGATLAPPVLAPAGVGAGR